MKKKLVIFDFDGVIVDSEPVWIEQQIIHYRENYGIELTHKMCEEHIGEPIKKTVAKIAKKYNLANGIDDEKAIRAAVLHSITSEPVEIQGAKGFINTLSIGHYHVAIASSSPVPFIKGILGILDIHSIQDCHIFSGEQCENNKPAPDIYLKVLNHFGVDASEAIVFEDSIVGHLSAYAAGIDVVSVPHPSQKEMDIFKKSKILISNYLDKDMLLNVIK